jgi:hypothetical protein
LHFDNVVGIDFCCFRFDRDGDCRKLVIMAGMKGKSGNKWPKAKTAKKSGSKSRRKKKK